MEKRHEKGGGNIGGVRHDLFIFLNLRFISFKYTSSCAPNVANVRFLMRPSYVAKLRKNITKSSTNFR